MIAFFKSRIGMACLVAFTFMMAIAFHRVGAKRRTRDAAAPRVAIARTTGARADETPVGRFAPATAPASTVSAIPSPNSRQLTEDAAYLDRYLALDGLTRADHDRQGNRVTRRETPSGPREAVSTPEPEESPAPAALSANRPTLRLQGHAPSAAGAPTVAAFPAKTVSPVAPEPSPTPRPAQAAPPSAPAKSDRARPARFNPYGRLIKCELVFTIDSTNEQTPLVAVVMEPVYNNGELVIPAGAEFHGAVRPDRLRNRLFSAPDWILVFPREPNRINGRQLSVHGVALDRVEPDANGMTWGITDGSYGLEGLVIRTLRQEEIKRFVATFFASGSLALQDRQTDRIGQQAARNTPQNAALQGLAANFQRIVDDISREIEEHGVFIRVPAGHQFYFYPMQIIDPDAADISSDIATVK